MFDWKSKIDFPVYRALIAASFFCLNWNWRLQEKARKRRKEKRNRRRIEFYFHWIFFVSLQLVFNRSQIKGNNLISFLSPRYSKHKSQTEERAESDQPFSKRIENLNETKLKGLFTKPLKHPHLLYNCDMKSKLKIIHCRFQTKIKMYLM